MCDAHMAIIPRDEGYDDPFLARFFMQNKQFLKSEIYNKN